MDDRTSKTDLEFVLKALRHAQGGMRAIQEFAPQGDAAARYEKELEEAVAIVNRMRQDETTAHAESDCSTGIGGVTLVQMAENIKLGLNPYTGSETPARRPIDCKHERADIRCPDCGIDFRGASYTDTASRRDAVRYRWLRDWYHREGKRAEIDPDGHVAVRTLPEWEALLDAAIARSSSVEPS